MLNTTGVSYKQQGASRSFPHVTMLLLSVQYLLYLCVILYKRRCEYEMMLGSFSMRAFGIGCLRMPHQSKHPHIHDAHVHAMKFDEQEVRPQPPAGLDRLGTLEDNIWLFHSSYESSPSTRLGRVCAWYGMGPREVRRVVHLQASSAVPATPRSSRNPSWASADRLTAVVLSTCGICHAVALQDLEYHQRTTHWAKEAGGRSRQPRMWADS